MAERGLVLRGGQVVRRDAAVVRADVLIGSGVIQAVGEDMSVPSGAIELDCGGCYVGPGLVDLHTHLREPGREEAETVETGSRAAALGGFTTAVAMPNTEPAIDSAEMVQAVQQLGRRAALIDVRVAGAITAGRAGERLAPMAEMAAAGVRLFTDDGSGVADAALMCRALEYAAGLGVTLAQHCEDPVLSAGGAMHEGEWSSRLGIPAQPPEAEELMVLRDIALARRARARIHFQHLSTARSVEIVRRARAEGVAVTAEATPHHFTLTHAECASYDPVFKVNPPLRTYADVAGVKAGLADGTLDAIATDHAPHATHLKELPFDSAPPGMLGLETALGLALTELQLPIERVFALMSWQPGAIAGVEVGLEVGAGANLCVVDPTATWTVDPQRLASKARNTPYAGRTLTGRVRHTVFRGEPVVIDAEAQR